MPSNLSKSDRDEIENLITSRRDAALWDIASVLPTWEIDLRKRERKVAIGKLKIEKELLEIGRLETLEGAVKEQLRIAEINLNKKLPLSAPDRFSRRSCPATKTACEAINDVIEMIHLTEMKKDPIGKKIVAENDRCENRLMLLMKCGTREDVEKFGVLD
jgi:hypothetical protein